MVSACGTSSTAMSRRCQRGPSRCADEMLCRRPASPLALVDLMQLLRGRASLRLGSALLTSPLPCSTPPPPTLQVVGQSADAVAVCKPHGMPVHVAGQYRKNTVHGILTAERPDLGPLYPVHRCACWGLLHSRGTAGRTCVACLMPARCLVQICRRAGMTGCTAC